MCVVHIYTIYLGAIYVTKNFRFVEMPSTGPEGKSGLDISWEITLSHFAIQSIKSQFKNI